MSVGDCLGLNHQGDISYYQCCSLLPSLINFVLFVSINLINIYIYIVTGLGSGSPTDSLVTPKIIPLCHVTFLHLPPPVCTTYFVRFLLGDYSVLPAYWTRQIVPGSTALFNLAPFSTIPDASVRLTAWKCKEARQNVSWNVPFLHISWNPM